MARTKYPGITRRTLPDGSERFDVRYRLANGDQRWKACPTITAAREFQATTKADRARGGLVDPKAGRITLAIYAAEWIDSRADLRPRTVDLYRSLLRLHIEPGLGRTKLAALDPASIRSWHAKLTRSDVGAPTVAKAYRLLRAILNTAVADGRILTNPCQIKRAGLEAPAERTTVPPAQVWAITEAVAKQRRCMVLLAGFCGLRLGEILGLAVRHVDLLHGRLTVERQLQEVGAKGAQRFTAPKSAASRRVLPIPAPVAAELRLHLEAMVDAGPESLLFTGVKGGPLRRHVWHDEWVKAREAAGHPKLHFHDLRHSALTLYAATGATVAELQAHAGHGTSAAAMKYQHATQDRANALVALVGAVIDADRKADSGVVRVMDA